MRVDQARHHRPPVQVDDAGGVPNVPVHVPVAAHGQDAIAADGQRACLWRLRILGQQQAIAQNDVGLLGMGRRRKQDGEREQQPGNTHGRTPLNGARLRHQGLMK